MNDLYFLATHGSTTGGAFTSSGTGKLRAKNHRGALQRFLTCVELLDGPGTNSQA